MHHHCRGRWVPDERTVYLLAQVTVARVPQHFFKEPVAGELVGWCVMLKTICVIPSWICYLCPGRWPVTVFHLASLVPVTGAVEHVRESDCDSCSGP